MKKITSISNENGERVFFVGDLPFGTEAEAKEFLDWLDWLLQRIKGRATPAEIWAGRQRGGPGPGNPSVHDIASGLAYLSFTLFAAGVVDHMHLNMVQGLTYALGGAQKRQQAAGANFAARMDRARGGGQPSQQEQPKAKNPAPGM